MRRVGQTDFLLYDQNLKLICQRARVGGMLLTYL